MAAAQFETRWMLRASIITMDQWTESTSILRASPPESVRPAQPPVGRQQLRGLLADH